MTTLSSPGQKSAVDTVSVNQPAPAKQGVLNRLAKQVARVWSLFISLIDCLTCGLFASCLKQKRVTSTGHTENQQVIAETGLSTSTNSKRKPTPDESARLESFLELLSFHERKEMDELNAAVKEIKDLFDSVDFDQQQIEDCFKAFLPKLPDVVSRMISDGGGDLKTLLELVNRSPDRIDALLGEDLDAYLEKSIASALTLPPGSCGGGDFEDDFGGGSLTCQDNALAIEIVSVLVTKGAGFSSAKYLDDGLKELVLPGFLKESLLKSKSQLFKHLVKDHEHLLAKIDQEGELLEGLVEHLSRVTGTSVTDSDREDCGYALEMMRSLVDAGFSRGVEKVLPSLSLEFALKEARELLTALLEKTEVDWKLVSNSELLIYNLVDLLRDESRFSLSAQSMDGEGALLPLTSVVALLLDKGLPMPNPGELEGVVSTLWSRCIGSPPQALLDEVKQLLALFLQKLNEGENKPAFQRSFSYLVDEVANTDFTQDVDLSSSLECIKIFQKYAVPIDEETKQGVQDWLHASSQETGKQVEALRELLRPYAVVG